MLTSADLEHLEEHAKMYDHDWSYYSIFLGEPFLIDDLLCYYDGTILYICAYSVLKPHIIVSAARLGGLINSFLSRERVLAVTIWGNCEALSSIEVKGSPELTLAVERAPKAGVFDTCVDVQRFDLSEFKKARLAHNSVLKSELDVRQTAPKLFSAAHISLIWTWLKSHDVAQIHLNFVTALTAQIRDPRTAVIEVSLHGRLVGFGVLSQPTRKLAVLLQAYSSKAGGLRVGDAMYSYMINEVASRGVSRLSLGYSETGSLLRFKRKWGATIDLPPYREIFLTAVPHLSDAFTGGVYPWQQRLFQEIHWRANA